MMEGKHLLLPFEKVYKEAVSSQITNQSVADDTLQVLVYTTNNVESLSEFTLVKATGIWTCNKTGLYTITSSVTWAANATGYREILITVTRSSPGVTLNWAQDAPAITGDAMSQFITATSPMTSGDTVKISGYQNSTGALNCAQIVTHICKIN